MRSSRNRPQTAMGVDPGIANTGFAIVERSGRGGYKCLDSGFVKTSPRSPVGLRLHSIIEAIEVQLVSVDVIGVESVFFAKNVSSALTTANVIGAVELTAYRAAVPCIQIRPNAVKAAVVGAEKGDKALIRQRIELLLGTAIKNHHEADAVAVAVASLQMSQGRMIGA